MSEAKEAKGDEEKKANEWKERGNKEFAEHHFAAAVESYSKAIEVCNDAVFFANRAFCHIKLENYGLAVEDATTAIQLNTSYIKGYYRRGAAYIGMGKRKLALKDFTQVVKIAPKNKEARDKLKECKKALMEEAFSEAIANEPVQDWKTIEVESDYKGPRLADSGPTRQFLEEMIEHFTNQKTIHRRYVYKIVSDVHQIFAKLPTLIDVEVPTGTHITVCGDVHGQFYDLLNIFKINGLPSEENPYLFNGDFVDRGSFSLEIILTFFVLKLLYPQHFHMLRGNHESRNMNGIYGFKGEVVQKVDNAGFELFSEAFNHLPLAAVLGNRVLVVHGGLFSKDGVTLDDIRKINRVQQPPDQGLMCELMWSDPQPRKGRAPSKRGVGLSFGPDVTQRFLNENKLDMVVRSHEVKEEGYEIEHDGRLVTVFSAPNYCDTMGNKGAFIRFDSQLKPSYTKFTAVPHPNVAPMAFAQPGLF